MRMPRITRSRAILALLALTGLAAAFAARAQARPGKASFSPHVGPSGEIARPVDHRTRWVHLGSWAVHDDKSPARGFHDVYAQPEAVAAYRARGSWPDGAVLLKEIRPIQAQTLSTGALYRAAGARRAHARGGEAHARIRGRGARRGAGGVPARVPVAARVSRRRAPGHVAAPHRGQRGADAAARAQVAARARDRRGAVDRRSPAPLLRGWTPHRAQTRLDRVGRRAARAARGARAGPAQHRALARYAAGGAGAA